MSEVAVGVRSLDPLASMELFDHAGDDGGNDNNYEAVC